VIAGFTQRVRQFFVLADRLRELTLCLEYSLFEGADPFRSVLQAPAERGHFLFEDAELLPEFFIGRTVANIGILVTHQADLLLLSWTLSGLPAPPLTGLGSEEFFARKWAPGSSSGAKATMVSIVPIPPHEEV
jgi:hypothetical protein